jgi:hypothetical protein
MRPGWGIAVLALSAFVGCQDGGAPSGVAPAESASVSVGVAPSAASPAAASSPAPPLSPRRAAFLAADVSARVADARASEEHPSRVLTVADLFVIAAGDASAPVDAAAALAQRLVDVLYAGPFSHRPDQGVVVWVYSSQPAFTAGAALHLVGMDVAPGDFGVYDPADRILLARADAGGVGGHEFVHPLFEADFPHARPWLAEGLPALFEVSDLSDPQHPRFGAHFRLQTLRDALASKDAAKAAIVRLDTLFDPLSPFNEEKTKYLRFACAREALRWIQSRGKLWEFVHRYRDTVLEDPNGTAAFAHVMGKTPAEATPEWLAWIHSKAAEGSL